MERCFIHELVRKVEFGCIENGQPNPSAIEGAVNAINVVFGTRLCPDVGRSRVIHLRECYDTFNWLINRLGVRWIPRPKLVLVNEALWDVIEWENPFARAYRWDTEPAWDELKIIFGQPNNEPIHNSDDDVYADPLKNPDEIVVEIIPDHKGSW
ncbi:hypothetical protein Salat_1416100 [Sesamum alatum]|uniref:Uncharacterized protein n=1 Tax=Sesamum alatum TaxID=300844 RepID=A0AAE1YA25_9LAMI|nr:hypothetical protein Salat_1416100 [Sesamum alatum]